MSRLLLSTLPVPALALLAALSCGRSRSEEPAVRVIPPPTPYVAPAPAPAAAGAPPAAAPATDPAATEEPPSAEEVQAFERPVAK